MGMLKVSAQSNAIRAAGALANTIRQAGEAEIQAIGPKAVNQTVKAIAIARSYLASSGIDLVAIPHFVDVEIEGEPRTAIRFYVTSRHRLIEAAKAQTPAPTQTQKQTQTQTQARASQAPTAADSESASATATAPAPASPAPGGPGEQQGAERTGGPPPEVLAGTRGSEPPAEPEAAEEAGEERGA